MSFFFPLTKDELLGMINIQRLIKFYSFSLGFLIFLCLWTPGCISGKVFSLPTLSCLGHQGQVFLLSIWMDEHRPQPLRQEVDLPQDTGPAQDPGCS